MATVESNGELLRKLQSIDPYDFERFVADLWDRQGYETEVRQTSSDQGVDVIATQTGPVNTKIAIQAKRYSKGNKVGRPQLQQYHSVKHQDRSTDSVAVVTTGEFTSNAKAWAYENNVKIIDGGDLVDIVITNDATDLVDQYVDPDREQPRREIQTESEIQPTSAESTVESIRDAFARSMYPSILAITAIWFAAAYLAYDFSGFVNTLSWLTIVAIHLILPAVIYKDAKQLHRSESAYRPNRILWPTFALFFGGIAGAIYAVQRLLSL